MSDREQRRDERVEERLAVELDTGAEKASAFSRNVSMGGMFVETDLKLKTGDKLRLTFTVPAQREPIVTEAQVRWTEPGGVGVRFIGLRAKDTWALGRLLGGSGPVKR